MQHVPANLYGFEFYMSGKKGGIIWWKGTNIKTENPTPDEIFRFGTIGSIMKILKLPDGRLKILIHGLIRAKLVNFKQNENCFMASIKKIIEKEISERTLEIEALMRNVKSQMEKSLSLGKALLPDVVAIAGNIEDPGKLADLIVSNLVLKTDETQEVLEIIVANAVALRKQKFFHQKGQLRVQKENG